MLTLLAWKTCFLVDVTSAASVREIHSLSADPSSLQFWASDSAFLPTQPFYVMWTMKMSSKLAVRFHVLYVLPEEPCSSLWFSEHSQEHIGSSAYCLQNGSSSLLCLSCSVGSGLLVFSLDAIEVCKKIFLFWGSNLSFYDCQHSNC